VSGLTPSLAIHSSASQPVQGYLAHKKQCPPRTLQYDYAYGPMEALGGEGLLLMSEVSLYMGCSKVRTRTPTTRQSTPLSSKVNLHRAINLRASCGGNLVT